MNQKADSALNAISTPADHETWYKLLMAYKAAGGDEATADAWSARGEGYNKRDFISTWKSIKPTGGITEATLYKAAIGAGWIDETSGGDNYSRHTVSQPQNVRNLPQARARESQPGQPSAEINAYIFQAQKQAAAAIPYLLTRGIEEETARRFNIGFDGRTQEIVIPYPGADSPYYVARYTKSQPNEKGGKRYRYPASATKQLFNLPALNSDAEVVFITEGQIDTITIEQAGAAAVASNEAGQLLAAIKAHGTTAEMFLIVADADTTGESKAVKMRDELTAAGYRAFILNLPAGIHDINDYLLKDKLGFLDWIEHAPEKPLEEYNATSGAGRLNNLFNYIQKNAENPPIKTGYPSLDLALGDNAAPSGLTPGLYTIGASSSIGKTTFILQMADNIAAAGHDVIIIALEMSANELIAKSISRLTTVTATSDADRKTVQGILQGARWKYYSQSERQTIDKATALYRDFAKHIFIMEGVGNIGAAQIREATKKHIQVTGNTPVVIIDYLQILAPADVRATDKANTDLAVLELKRISRDYDTPVIAISSFNRQAYKGKVELNAFKESGAVEYTADVAIGLQPAGMKGGESDKIKAENNELTEKCKAAAVRDIEAVILKNRSGRTMQTVKFTYDARFNLFVDVNQGHQISPQDSEYIRRQKQAEMMR